MLEEFKKFAMRGNVVDLAVGVIIGAAFGAIVKSLVGDIIMPVIGAVTGGLDFSNYFLPLSSKVTATTLADAKKQGAVLAWGNFLTLAINFLIVAWILFMLIKGINRLNAKRRAEKAPALLPKTGSAVADRNPRPAQEPLRALARMATKPEAARSKSSPTIARRGSIMRSARPSRPASRSPAPRSNRCGSARRRSPNPMPTPRGGEIWLINANIPEYLQANRFNHAPEAAAQACCCTSARSTSWPARSSARA